MACGEIDQIAVECKNAETWGTKILLRNSTFISKENLEEELNKFSYSIYWDFILTTLSKVEWINEYFFKEKKKIIQVEVKMIRSDWLFKKTKST